ncbi:MAG: hypothetical protein EP341_02975 [Sphingomonadales bacterium]|nr:MAG: hypothetical protein EP341_02975 [Sphingomonadales bacterium]
MTDARKRIAELEEALRPFAPSPETLQAIQYIHDGGELSLGENGWGIVPITAGDLRRAALLLSEQTETPAEETGGKEMLPCPFCGDPPSEMHEHHKKHLPKIYWCECDGYSTQADEDDADYKTAQEWNDPEWRAPAQETGGDVERVAK